MTALGNAGVEAVTAQSSLGFVSIASVKLWFPFVHAA